MIDVHKIFANPPVNMTSKTRNRLLVALILAFPFMVALGFLIFQTLRPLPPPKPLPNPNGYDVLAKAGAMVSTNSWDYDKMNREQLRELVAANAAALTLARAGLSNECRVPVQFSEAYIKNHISELAGLKWLAQAFVVEGKLAELENRPGDAAKSYLDTVHASNESVRGGVLIDQLVGITMETLGTGALTNLVDQLDAKACRETATTLETLDGQRQTFAEVMQQENDWSHRTFPGIRYEFVRLMMRKSLLPAQAAGARKFGQQQTRTRQLFIALAARAYELDKGHRPASLADLVPDYLKAIPQDPLTGTNLTYTP
jgi:hypothetical protein